MKTLYVHIGTQKTGTTSIQGFCQDNEEVLESRGYCYPIFPYEYPRVSADRNGHFLVGSIKDENGNRCEEEEKRIFREGMDHVTGLLSRFDNVILSDEHIWQTTYKVRKSLWEELKQEGEKAGFQVKIIVYLRRQDEFINSLWNQTVKAAIREGRSKKTFDEFIAKVPGISQLDYYKKLETIADVLGKENIIVRIFEKERFEGGSIYSDFLKTVGLELTSEYQIRQSVKNMGLAGNTHEIKRVLNSLPEISERDTNNFLRDILLDCSEISKKEYPCSMFSREEAKEFMAQYQKSNQCVLREYLKEDGEELFHTDIPDLPKWEKDNPYMQEDIIRFVGMSTIHLLDEMKKENEKLKEEQEKLKCEFQEFRYKVKHPFFALYRIIVRKFQKV